MFEPAPALPLPKELVELMEKLARSLPPYSPLAQRAWIYVMASEGIPNGGAAKALLVNESTVRRWRDKFASGQDPQKLIHEETRGRKRTYSHEFEKQVVEVACRYPHFSTRRLAQRFGVSHMTIQRILKNWQR